MKCFQISPNYHPSLKKNPLLILGSEGQRSRSQVRIVYRFASVRSQVTIVYKFASVFIRKIVSMITPV